MAENGDGVVEVQMAVGVGISPAERYGTPAVGLVGAQIDAGAAVSRVPVVLTRWVKLTSGRR
jgi:hypothetical protein